MTSPTTPSSLHALFLFNADLGEEATEARKLLYFWDNRPATLHRRTTGGEREYVDLNYQKDLCGIAEGLIAFTRDFAPETLCESVHCEKHRYAFLQPEPNYWMVLVVNNPTVMSKEAQAKKDAAEGAVTTEYLEEELEDSVLQAIIHRCYSLFALFNSTFEEIVQESSHDALRVRLSLFMAYFLPTIRFSQLIYFTDIHGFQFLPVGKVEFLTIQYLLNLLTANFAPPNGTTSSSSSAAAASELRSLTGSIGSIRNCALMYNSKLIYSGLNSDVMFLLYSLDQDLMYWFLVEYLTAKENLHMDIQRYYAALKQLAPAPAGKAWEVRPPPTIPNMYNVPESVYERNGRVAVNKKMFERAQNKGEVPQDLEWEGEDESTSHVTEQAEDDGVLLERDPASLGGAASRSGSNASALPYGFMTGPYRVPLSSGTLAGPAFLGASAQTSGATLPGFQPAGDQRPCGSAPRIWLDQCAQAYGGDTAKAPRGKFGSGNPEVERNLPVYGSFPGTAATASATDEKSPSPPSSTGKPLRLVVYQKYKITLFLIVEDDSTPASTSATTTASSSSSATKKPDLSSDLASLHLSSSSSFPPSPPLGFYTALESFMESQLKKLAEMLQEQTMRIGGGGAGGTGAGQAVEEPFRFLYFNHMNLALKTSLSSSAPSSGSKSGSSSSSGQNSSGGSLLTIESIKLIREIHQDFNTRSFRSGTIGTRLASLLHGEKYREHSIREEGCTEVCVKTRHHGWVVGRRATQSHREFFLLLEEKIANLAEIQEEVEALAKTYFYNIFIH
jgi:hypothetical protein